MAETPTPQRRDVSRETVRQHRDSVGPSLEAPCRAVEKGKSRLPRCPGDHWEPGFGPCVCEGRVHR